MKKILLSIASLLLIASQFVMAQSQLASPDQLNTKSLGFPLPGQVEYGDVPANSSSKPVMLFVHGYISNGISWYVLNDMYTKAYNAGYRTAFVSLYPTESMWTNGPVLRDLINETCQHYGVSKVTIVAHSKGGIDTDAALVHYGAYNKVEQVISLSSPHFGTALADLAHSSWVWWLSAVFGQVNNATYVLQTGYMNYFRSITDNHTNNQINYKSIGGWGYGGVFLASGWYLNANGGAWYNGGNDGVVCYKSTKRPNTQMILSGYGDYRTDYDHLEMQQGKYMWKHIEAQLSGKSNALETTPNQINPNAIVESNAQIVFSKKGTTKFKLNENDNNVHVMVYEMGQSDELKISNSSATFTGIESPKSVNEQNFISQSVKEVNIPKAQSGIYTIESDVPFVAVITSDNTITARLNTGLSDSKLVYNTNEVVELSLEMLENNQLLSGDFAVTAMVQRTLDLEGNLVQENAEFIPVSFTKTSLGTYSAQIKNLKPGTYNISASAENAKSRRNLTTSFSVVGTDQSMNNDLMDFNTLTNYPNPVKDQTNIMFEKQNDGAAFIQIFDVSGKLFRTIDLTKYEKGKQSIQMDAKDLQEGVYFYRLVNGTNIQTAKMVIEK